MNLTNPITLKFPVKPLRIPLALLALTVTSLTAKTVTLSPDNEEWITIFNGPSLQPGDEIILTEGTYSALRRLQISQRGTADKPITIRAAEGAKFITLENLHSHHIGGVAITAN